MIVSNPYLDQGVHAAPRPARTGAAARLVVDARVARFGGCTVSAPADRRR